MSTMTANPRLVQDFQTFMRDPKRLRAIQAVAPRHLTPERLLKIAVNAVSRNPKLLECEVTTVYAAIVQAAELGLEPGGVMGQAYLVPFYNNKTKRTECQLIPGYMGYIDLAYRSGKVLDVHADAVCEGDDFEYQLGSSIIIKHRKADGPREAEHVTHAYAVAHIAGGGVVCEVMTRWELEQARNRSKAKDSGPWITDTLEMFRKTAVRRMQKYVPRSVEMNKLAALDAAIDTGDQSLAEFDSAVIEGEIVEPDKGAKALKSKIGIGNGDSPSDEPAIDWGDGDPANENTQ